MTTKLTIYNGALTTHLGENALTTLTDDRPARYALDDVWDRDGVETCLQLGQWNFAARSQRLEFESTITPEFGYRYAFQKPTDFVRTMGICSDELFEMSLRQYHDESGFWWCDLEQLYVRYVSKDSLFGLDYSLWPHNFTRMVEAWFAVQITNLSTYSDKKKDVKADYKDLLRDAKSTDAMEQPSRTNPPGSWSSARVSDGQNDFGSRSRLTG